MPKIIKYGDFTTDKIPILNNTYYTSRNIDIINMPTKLTCEDCGTIAEFETNEFEIIPWSNTGRKVTCPICGETILIYIIQKG